MSVARTDSPKFDDLKALVSRFVKENAAAKIHFTPRKELPDISLYVQRREVR